MILLLGFSSGLPYLLTNTTLQAWMTKEGVSLTSIGLFSLVGVPYSFKFLWSPLLDRYVPPFMGRRRGWLVITQIALILAISCMFFQQPKQALQLLAVNALFIAFFSASQDISFDAYRTDVLVDEQETVAGAAISILGYRLALVITGSLALILADRLPWNLVYLFLAGLMLVGLVSTFFAPEPTKPVHAPESLVDAIILPFTDFFQNHGAVLGVSSLLFITLYKFGDSVLNNMSIPFLLQTGFSQTDIGVIRGGMGILATLVGTLVGGSLMIKLGIYKSLWIFGALQCLSNLGYLALSLTGQNYQLLVLSINIENFCGGMGSAAYVAYLMSLCNPNFTATQYALLSSLMAVSRDILIAPAGKIAELTGWTNFMIISIVAAIPGLLLLPLVAPWNTKLKQ